MNINIICIGKLKEKYWRDACEEYLKRLGAYCNINILELKEARLEGEGKSAELAVKESEGRDILSRLDSDSYIVALDVRGKKLSSEGLAEKLNSLALEGKSNISLIIGGSLGLTNEVLSKAHYRLSFSDMTFPHQMMRVILLEQVYRAYKINRGETYHK